MRDFSELVGGLSNEEVSSLLYSLCRSGKVIIPQFYTTDNVGSIIGKTPSVEVMNIAQESYEYDDELIDILNEKLHFYLVESE